MAISAETPRNPLQPLPKRELPLSDEERTAAVLREVVDTALYAWNGTAALPESADYGPLDYTISHNVAQFTVGDAVVPVPIDEP